MRFLDILQNSCKPVNLDIFFLLTILPTFLAMITFSWTASSIHSLISVELLTFLLCPGTTQHTKHTSFSRGRLLAFCNSAEALLPFNFILSLQVKYMWICMHTCSKSGICPWLLSLFCYVKTQCLIPSMGLFFLLNHDRRRDRTEHMFKINTL